MNFSNSKIQNLQKRINDLESKKQVIQSKQILESKKTKKSKNANIDSSGCSFKDAWLFRFM